MGSVTELESREVRVAQIPEGFSAEPTGLDKALSFIAPSEGGFAVVGGMPTNAGVEQGTYDSFAKKNGFDTKPVKDLTQDEIRSFYDKEFFSGMDFNMIESERVRNLTFSTEINTEYRRGIKMLQEVVGSKPDGILGAKTVAALNEKIAQEGEDEVLQEMLDKKTAFYNDVAASNPEKKKFLKGWLNRVKEEAKMLDIADLNPFAIKEAYAEEAPIKGELPDGRTGFAVEIPEGFVAETDEIIDTPDGQTFLSAAPEKSLLGKAQDFIANKLMGKADKDMKRADLVYALAKANRLPISVVDKNLDTMLKNPEFTGIRGEFQQTLAGKQKEVRREKTLKQNIGEGLSFGFYKGDAELKKEFPVSAGAGQVIGGVAAFIGTAEVLAALGLGRLALNIGAKAEVVTHLAPRFLPPALTSGTVFATNAGLREMADQVHEGDLNVFALGGKTMKGFLEGSALGIAGRTMGYFRRVVMASGVGYVAAKTEGASDSEAALQGAIYGGFEAIGGSGRDMELKRSAATNLRDNLAKYAEFKMPEISPSQAKQMASAYLNKLAKPFGGFEKGLKETPIQLMEKLSARLKQVMTDWKGVKNVNALEIPIPKLDTAGNPAPQGAGQAKPAPLASLKSAGKVVSGLKVREDVPSKSSIAASLDNYEVQDGIKEIPMSEFELTGRSYSKDYNDRVRELQSEIEASGEISPLIVVQDNEGYYILEGAHRADALYNMGKKSIPALVVKDLGSGSSDPLFSINPGKFAENPEIPGDVDPYTGKVAGSEPPFTSMSKDKRQAKAKIIKETQEQIPLEAEIDTAARRAVKNRQTLTATRAYDTNKYINTLEQLTTSDERKAVTFLIEGKGVPENMKGTEIERIYKEDGEKLKPVVDSVKKHLDQGWEYFKKNMDTMTEADIENYVTHVWDLPRRDKKTVAAVTSWFTTKNRFAKKRLIESYKEGIDKFGLKPKTLDVAEIIRIHDAAINRSVANKIFVEEINDIKAAGVPLVERADKAPRDWVYVDHPELRKAMVIPGEIKRGEKVSEEMKSILHELGVIIGSRIHPKIFGKPNPKAGQFRPGKKPEINLQRFFTSETLAHEIGHFIDQKLGLTGLGGKKKSSEFFDRFKNELRAVNEDRIQQFKGSGKEDYAESAEEQIAEYFALLFTNADKAVELAPATTEHVMKLLSNDKNLKKLANFNFATKAKTLIDEQMNTMVKLPVKVHPSLVKPIEAVLGGRFQHPAIHAYEAVGGVLKKMQLSLSLFHHLALGETSIPTMGVKKTLDLAFNFPKIYKAIAKGDYEIYKREEAAKTWIAAGLQVGATADIPVHKIQKSLNDLAEKMKDIPIAGKAAKFIATFNDTWDKALWNYYHDTMKLLAAETLFENNADLNKPLMAQREEIATIVNDTFGGQNWERLLVSPKTLQIASWMLLSPDWTISTVRQFLSPTGAGAINKETKGLRAQMGQKFWIKAAIYFGVGVNLLNAATRKADEKANPEYYKDKEMKWADYTLFGNAIGHKTHLFAGRYADGTERYIRWGKQFREVPELVFDDTGFSPVTASIKKIGGKASPQLQLLSTATTGHTLSGFRVREVADAEGWERTMAIMATLLKSPLPFSTRTIGRDDKEFFLTDLAMPSSKGMTRYKAVDLFKYAIEAGDEQMFKEIYQDTVDNNLPAMVLVDSAITSLKSEGTREIKEHAKSIEQIDEQLPTADEKETRTLMRIKGRLLKEQAILQEGNKLLEVSLEKLRGEGYFGEEEL